MLVIAILCCRRPQFMTFSDDEDEKRVVKSLKDKRCVCVCVCIGVVLGGVVWFRYDEIKEVIRALRNSMKIKDVAKVQTRESYKI